MSEEIVIVDGYKFRVYLISIRQLSNEQWSCMADKRLSTVSGYCWRPVVDSGRLNQLAIMLKEEQ